MPSNAIVNDLLGSHAPLCEHRNAPVASPPPNGSLRLHIVGNPVRIRKGRRAAWLRPMNHCRHKRWQADERTHWRIG